MKTISHALVALILILSSNSHAAFQCEALFAGRPATSLDSLLIENSDLFPHTQKFLLRSESANGPVVRLRIGRFGISQTFEEELDLTRSSLEGLQTRETMWPHEGASLELQIKELTTQNDIWTVPLASEMDAVAFLIATKFHLETRVSDDYRAGGFVVHAGVANAESKMVSKDMKLGDDFKIVGVSTERIRVQGDSVLVLKVKDEKSNQIFRIEAKNQRALAVAKLLISKGGVRISLRGNQIAN